jgi:uncharacterized protein YecE (DUF72 family)
MKPGDIRIGVSGWTYAPWRGEFFPEGLRQRDELAYAARMFRTIEVNGTFYSLQKPDSFARWADAVPEDFVFTVKGPRYVTHILRLREPRVPVANFLASGVLRLGHKLGPILWQLPPSLAFDAERIRNFAALLPHDTDAAVALARRHDDKVAGRVWLKPATSGPLRHALEIRHESFRTAEFIDILRAHDIALVCADTVKWPRLMDATADFAYCRLHGSRELYRSGYDARQLDEWHDRITAWATGRPVEGDFAAQARPDHRHRDVFLFFDNTDKLQAPKNARSLMERLGQV